MRMRILDLSNNPLRPRLNLNKPRHPPRTVLHHVEHAVVLNEVDEGVAVEVVDVVLLEADIQMKMV